MTEINCFTPCYYACFHCRQRNIEFDQSHRILLWKRAFSHDIPLTSELLTQTQHINSLMKSQNVCCAFFCCIPCVWLGCHNNHAFFELMTLVDQTTNLRVNTCCMFVTFMEISDPQAELLSPNALFQKDRETTVEMTGSKSITIKSTLSQPEIDEIHTIQKIFDQTSEFVEFTRLMAEQSFTRFTFIKGQNNSVSKVYYYAYSYPRLVITNESFTSITSPTIINPMTITSSETHSLQQKDFNEIEMKQDIPIVSVNS